MFVLLSVFTLLTRQTNAATPTLTFQARLESNTGAIAPDGNYNIEFNLYEGGTVNGGGTKKWTEDHTYNGGSPDNRIRVVNGYFSVNLGSITNFPSTINWDDDLFLSMTMGGTTTGPITWDSEMTPYLKLTAVPYAFQSQSSEQLSQSQGGIAGQLTFDTLTGASGTQKFVLPDQGAPGTYDLLTGSVANGLYIQNSASLQAGATFNIGGTGKANLFNSVTGYQYNGTPGSTITCSGGDFLQDAAVQGGIITGGTCAAGGGGGGITTVGTIDTGTYSDDGASISGSTIYLQAASASHTGLVTHGTQIFGGDKTFDGNVTIAAGQTLTLAGGNTAGRPVSPTEGTLYYDTSTHSLLIYNGTKWQADRSSNTEIVAPAGASQAVKDSADYVGNGTSDQTAINSALTAAAGGTVLLLPGTYTTTGTILIPNNTTLAGSGSNTTTVKLNVGAGTDNLIENSDTSTGKGVSVRDVTLDDSLGTGGTQNGVYLTNMDGEYPENAQYTGLAITNWSHGDSMLLDGSYLQTFHGNTTDNVVVQNGSEIYTFTGNYTGDVTVDHSFADTFTDNYTTGITFTTASNSVFTGNVTGDISSDNSTIAVFTDNASGYVAFTSTTVDTFSGNRSQTITLNGTTPGVSLDGNFIYSGSGETGITLTNADNVSISNNTFYNGGSAAGAISIDAASDGTYLSNNVLGGLGVVDNGTNTVYGGQQDTSGNYIIAPAGSGTIQLQGDTSITGNLTASGTINAVSGYKYNGTPGSTVSCSGGDVLQNAVVQGGIITGGTCVANGAGVSTFTGLTLAGSSGTNQTISDGDTITIAAGNNITTTGGATDTVTVATVNNPSFSGQITSTVATGTAPLVVSSTTKVANLNADQLDGLDSTAFQPAGSYLTSEADTLATVTARGATTSTASTFSGGLTVSSLTGTAALTIVAGGSNTALSLNANGTGGVNVGTNATAHTTTVGSTNTTSGTTIQSGSGGITLTGAVTTSSTINTATISGGSLTGGSLSATAVNGLSVSGGTITVGTWNGSVVGVQYGGTGAATFTTNGVLFGNGTSAIGVTAAGTTGQCLIATTGAAPAWGSCSTGGGITGSGTSGQLTYFNGTNTVTGSNNFTISGNNLTVAGVVSGSTLTSAVATGTAPLTVTSTTVVTNLNADLLDGHDSTYFQVAGSYLTSEADTLATVTARGATTSTASSFTGGATIRGLTVDTATGTNDKIAIQGTTIGATSFTGTITNSVDLTAARTWSLPDASGTFITTGNLSGITAVGTVASGTWQGTAVGAAYGGTGISSYTTGDLLYASGATSLSKLADVATGKCLISGGVGVAPAWGSCATGGGLTGSGTTGQVGYFSASSNLTSDAGFTYNQGTATLVATNIQGNGSAITSLNASNLASGTVNTARISGSYTGITAVGTLGSLTVSGTAAANLVNSTTGYQYNGTPGSSLTCTGGNVISNATVQGGIITGGGCVANGGGYAPTLQNVYDNSSPATIQLSSGKGMLIKDYSTTVGNIFQIQNSAGTTTYLGVTNSGINVSGTIVGTTLNVNAVQTNGFNRIDVNGNISNIGSTTSGGTITGVVAGALSVASGGTGQSLSLDASTTGQILIGGASTGDILLGGGSASTGCTVTNSSGAFACTSTINGATINGGTLSSTAVNGLSVSSGTISVGTWNGTAIGLAYGGTGNSLTASNGGIVYSDASKLQVLAGTATAGQCLVSGSNSAPSWSSCSAGALTGSGASGQVAYFNGGSSLTGSSNLQFDGTNMTVGGNITTTGGVLTIQGTGTNSLSGDLSVGGTLAINNMYPLYEWRTAGNTDLAWKTIANITIPTGLYRGAAFEVDVVDANSNFGNTSNEIPLRYYVSIVRSSGTQDDTDAATVSGPIADYVQVVETSNSTYELQVRQTANNRRVNFTSQATSVGSGVTIAYVASPATGSVGTTFSATVTHTDTFSNLTAAGKLTVQGTGVSAIAGTLNLQGANALQVGGTTVLTSARVLQNVTTDASIITTGTLGLARGGTGNSLTASNGGIVYSDASKLQVLAGTATAGQCLVSGANSAPTWGSCGGGALTGSGTSGRVAYFNGSSSLTSNANFTYDGTNLSIGPGNFNANVIQTGGTNRLDGSGNLYSIGTYSGSGNIQTSGGVLIVQGTGTSTFSGSLNVAGNTTVTGTLTLNNMYPAYAWRSGGGVDTNWKDVADISITTGAYTGVGFEVDVVDAKGNVAPSTTNVRPMKYYVAITRSGATQDDTDSATISGPFADYVQVVKIANDTYQLQFRTPANYDIVTFHAQAITSSGATVTYNSGPANGATGIATYTASALHYDYMTNAIVAGHLYVQGSGASTFADALNLQGANALQIGGTTVLTSARLLQNVTTDASIITTGTLGVVRGGTGAGTFTANGILYGNGTGALGVTAAGTTGQCLLANTGGAPTWGSCGSGFANTSLSNLSAVNIGTTALNSTSNNLNLTTTTSGNIVLNSAGTIELQDNTNVTGALTTKTTSATAFQVQNAGGTTTTLNVDTSSQAVTITANNSGSTLGAALVDTASGVNDFPASWSGPSWARGGNNAFIANTSATLTSAFTPVSGQFYRVSYTLSGTGTGGVTVSMGGVQLGTYSPSYSGTPIVYMTTTSTAPITVATTFLSGNVTLSNVRVQAVSSPINSTLTVKSSTGTIALAVQSSASSSNLFVGSAAGQYNIGGVNNTAFGTSALKLNTEGVGNTAIGATGLQSNTTGSYNTTIGASALQNNVSGTGNTALGYNALVTNVAGINNTALGRGADVCSDGLSNATAVGYGAQVCISDALVLGNGTAQVGINNSSPTYKLDVGGDINATGTIRTSGTARISSSGALNNIPSLNATGNLQINGDTNSNVSVNLNGSGGFYINNIGTASGTVLCILGGNQVVKSASGACNNPSSIAYKTNVVSLGDTLSILGQLRPVSFDWKASSGYTAANGGSADFGLIAQEVQPILPQLVQYDPDGTVVGLKYDGLIPFIIRGIQEQQGEIGDLQGSVGNLSGQISSNTGTIGSLSSQLAQTNSNVSQNQSAISNLQTNVSNLSTQLINGTFTGITVSANASIGGNLTVAGTTTLNGTLVAKDATFNGVLTVNGHIVAKGNAPTITVGDALGSGDGVDQATDPVVQVAGTDSAGSVTVTSGSIGETDGVLAHLAFATAFNTSYNAVISATNSNATDLHVYLVKTTGGFDIVSTDTPVAGQTYTFDYIVLGSQQVAAN